MRRRGLTLVFLLCAAAPAPLTPMLRAIRQRDWQGAASIAARNPDPLATTLLTFLRLVTPGQASPGEIDTFLTANPDWPDRTLLLRRRDEALIDDPDAALVATQCAARKPAMAEALARCADAAAEAGNAAQAAGYARLAWPGLPPALAPAFVARWRGALRPEDDWARFDRLDWAGSAAEADAAGLDSGHQALAAARLAFRRNDPGAPSLLAAVPAPLLRDAGLFLERARYLRRDSAWDAADSLWQSDGAASEAEAAPEHRPAFWTERDSLARALLDAGRVAQARRTAADPAATGEARADALFLSGWLALQLAGDVPAARRAFGELEAGASSVLTRSRALYWLGRAEEAAGDRAAARREYARAAAFPVAFYGQRAAAELGEPIRLPPDPPASATDTLTFGARATVRATVLLVSWDDPKRARDFLLYLAQGLHAGPDFALAAAQARALGLPDLQVRIARLAGRAGFMLPQAGWPLPAEPLLPAEAPAPLVLGLVRQESSFDPAIVSPAGAVGLMQLRPATAAELAHATRGHAPALTDPATNLRLGSAYLAQLLDGFDGNIALALAAYDAGPHRAAMWRDAHGVPAGERATIDWIERIPFAETRGYVQRVLENAAVYAAKTGRSFAGLGE